MSEVLEVNAELVRAAGKWEAADYGVAFFGFPGHLRVAEFLFFGARVFNRGRLFTLPPPRGVVCQALEDCSSIFAACPCSI